MLDFLKGKKKERNDEVKGNNCKTLGRKEKFMNSIDPIPAPQ